MNSENRNPVNALLGLVVTGLFASLGCEAAPAPATVDIAGFRPEPANFHAQEILRCCERRFFSRRRPECIVEALHDRGVCAQRPVPPRDAGSHDGSSKDAGGKDAGGKDAGGKDAGGRDAAAPDGQASNPDAFDAGSASCPILTPLAPNVLGTLPVGSTIQIFVSASAPNGGAAGLTFTWSTTGGSLESTPTTGDQFNLTGIADFRCTRAGTETVTVTIADGDCPLTESVDLTCSFCGDGVVESGEDCDPPNPTPDGRILCDSSCHFIGTCGNGRLDPGEQCDPPNPGFCGNDCQITAVCGDGLIGPGEQCDPPHQGSDGLQCDSNCQLLTCGNGMLDPGEQCDPPRSLSAPGQAPLCTQSCQIPTCGNQMVDPGEQCDPPDGATCNAQCQTIRNVCGDGIIQSGETCDFTSGPFCMSCQLTACGACFFESLGPNNVNPAPTDFVCQALTGVARTNCQALLNCMSGSLSHCLFAQPSAAQTACLCSDATCSAGINGQCAAQFEAVAGTTDPPVIIGELTSPGLLGQVRAEAMKFGTSSCGLTCSR
jgi:hypothetical protein